MGGGIGPRYRPRRRLPGHEKFCVWLGLTGRSRPHPNPFRKREAQFKFPVRVRDPHCVPVLDLLSLFRRLLHLPREALVQAYKLPVCGIAAWN